MWKTIQNKSCPKGFPPPQQKVELYQPACLCCALLLPFTGMKRFFLLIFAPRFAEPRQLIHGQGEHQGSRENEGIQLSSKVGPPQPYLPSAGRPARSLEGYGHWRNTALTPLATHTGQERLQEKESW